MSTIFKSYITLSSEIANYSASGPGLGNLPSPFINDKTVISSITAYVKNESDYVTSLQEQLGKLKTTYQTACGARGIVISTTLTLMPSNCQKATSACEQIISILNRVQDRYNRLKQGGKRQTRRRHSKHNKNRKQNLRSRRHRSKR